MSMMAFINNIIISIRYEFVIFGTILAKKIAGLETCCSKKNNQYLFYIKYFGR